MTCLLSLFGSLQTGPFQIAYGRWQDGIPIELTGTVLLGRKVSKRQRIAAARRASVLGDRQRGQRRQAFLKAPRLQSGGCGVEATRVGLVATWLSTSENR